MTPLPTILTKRRRRTSREPRPTPHVARTLTALFISIAFFGCTRTDQDPLKATANLPTDQTAQTAVAAPPGDSVPKPADSDTRSASESTDATSRSSTAQSTVGTAAAGAPPYTLNGAPEGNAAPKGGDAPKK